MKNNKFTLETENGPIECEMLEQLYVKEYNKSYLVYTDNTKDEDNELNIYISSFKESEDDIELLDITNQKELDTVSDILSDLWSE